MGVLFLQDVWDGIMKDLTCRRKNHFALLLLLKEEKLLHAFCKRVMGESVNKPSWERLCNACDAVHSYGHKHFFSDADWIKICAVFQSHCSSLELPRPLRQFMRQIRDIQKENLLDLIEKQSERFYVSDGYYWDQL
jgi:hypothetical protein